MGALAFSIKRAGLMFGTVGEDGSVNVDAVYEPPQQGSADSVLMERGTDEEQRAQEVAKSLGCASDRMGTLKNSAPEEEVAASGAVLNSVQVGAGRLDLFSQHQGAGFHNVGRRDLQQAVQLWKEGWFRQDVVGFPGALGAFVYLDTYIWHSLMSITCILRERTLKPLPVVRSEGSHHWNVEAGRSAGTQKEAASGRR
eukprot:scaffold310827_cov28-Prasinocladus_malaysianus.AAC.1